MEITINKYGEEFKIRFVKCLYEDGTLCILAEDYDSELDFWKPFSDVTKNLCDTSLKEDECYLDGNSGTEINKWLIENGHCKVIGEYKQGYCTYPKVIFTKEFLDSCIDMYE